MDSPEVQNALQEIQEGGGVLYPFRKGYERLAALLEILPDDAWRKDESVLSGLVLLLLKRGQSARAKSYLLARNLRFEKTYRLELLELLVALHLGEHVNERKLTTWRRLERKLPVQDTLFLGLYYNALLAILVRIGKLADARNVGQQAISCFREEHHNYLEHFIHVHLSDLDVIEGKLRQAQRGLAAAERCLALSDRSYGNEADIINVVRLAIAYERGDFTQVRNNSTELRESLVRGDSWSELFFQLARISVLSAYYLHGVKAAQDEIDLFHADYARRHGGRATTVEVLSSMVWRLEWNPNEAERTLETLDSVDMHSAVGATLLAEQKFLLNGIRTDVDVSPRAQIVAQLQHAQTSRGMVRTNALVQALHLAYKEGQIAPFLEHRDAFIGMSAKITSIPSIRRYPRMLRFVNQVFRKVESSYVVPETLRHIGFNRRQYRVAAALQAGATNKQVARQLGITEATVKYHLTTLFKLAGVSNRRELIEFVHSNGVMV